MIIHFWYDCVALHYSHSLLSMSCSCQHASPAVYRCLMYCCCDVTASIIPFWRLREHMRWHVTSQGVPARISSFLTLRLLKSLPLFFFGLTSFLLGEMLLSFLLCSLDLVFHLFILFNATRCFIFVSDGPTADILICCLFSILGTKLITPVLVVLHAERRSGCILTQGLQEHFRRCYGNSLKRSQNSLVPQPVWRRAGVHTSSYWAWVLTL